MLEGLVNITKFFADHIEGVVDPHLPWHPILLASFLGSTWGGINRVILYIIQYTMASIIRARIFSSSTTRDSHWTVKSIKSIYLSQSDVQQSELTLDARSVAQSCSSSISTMSSIFKAIRALPSLIWGLIGRLSFSLANQENLIAARVAQIDFFHLFCNGNQA